MPARIALIGYGKIAPKHLEALRAAGAEVVASCNRSEANREKARTEGRIPKTYASIGEMLEHEKPDGVVSCASFFEVYRTALEVLPIGIPTLLEKPPGTSLAEYEELRALAARHGTPVMVGLNRRFYGVVQGAVADAGGLAAITEVDVDWSEDARHFLKRGFTPEQVARMVFGNSLHGIDLMTHLGGGLPTPQITVRRGAERFDWNMAVQGLSDRGALLSFRSTWSSPGKWRLQLCASRRRYVFAPLETCVVQQSGERAERTIAPDPRDTEFKPGFFGQARAFLDMIGSRRAPDQASLDSVEPSMRVAEVLTTHLLAT